MEMYRDGIACVATMDISRLCFSWSPSIARGETQKLELPHR
jgi:hypothetical protein